MIPKLWIVEWRKNAPWVEDRQVEQDLVLTRAIVEIFAVDQLRESLTFRGGSALHKMHLRPPARYSEDIDLVQLRAGPIGETLDQLRNVLDPWLGTPRRKLNEGRVTLLYRFDSEDEVPVKSRLKIEINSREHGSLLDRVDVPVSVESRWFAGQARVPTFALDEMLATKLRALYQRRKGRDLFDLWMALENGGLDPARVVVLFLRYMEAEGHRVSRAEFEENLLSKVDEPDFVADVERLLRPGLTWPGAQAAERILDELISLLPGEPWKGREED